MIVLKKRCVLSLGIHSSLHNWLQNTLFIQYGQGMQKQASGR